jgi:predicted lipoprotein with Yx(FWY)xxD motif
MLSESRCLTRGRRCARQMSYHIGLVALAAAALSCLVAACGQAKTAVDAPAAQGRIGQHAVLARKLAGIGTALVDRSGKTIYSPEQEADGKIACTGSCLAFWFPVTVRPGTELSLPAGFAGRLGTIHRSDDGLTQLTYNAKPLYTFRLDAAAGQAHGNNFTDHFGSASFTWQVITAANPAKPKPAPSPTSSGYTGY